MRYYRIHLMSFVGIEKNYQGGIVCQEGIISIMWSTEKNRHILK